MPHAHHFLERLDRVTRAQTEFALELYRDHEAVAYVLDRVHLPSEAPRVALAIDDAREGPFVVVTRDGRFVTCLGAGMHHDLPVVPRSQIDALLAKVAEKRARRELAEREMRPDEEDEEDLFHRILTRGQRFAREDFLAISAFEAMLGSAPYVIMLDMALEALKWRATLMHGAYKVVLKEGTRKALERQDRIEWSVAHLMLLSAAGERRQIDEMMGFGKDPGAGSPTFPCSAQNGSTYFLRSAWAAARMGKPAIPLYRAVLERAEDWSMLFDAALGLGAIGLRHAGTLGEVRRILQALDTDPPAPEGQVANPAQVRSSMARAVLETIDKADERTEGILKIGADICVTYAEHLPEGHPLRFTDAERIPEHLARTMALGFDGNMYDAHVKTFVLCALPIAARAAAEDFYYPRDVVRAWYGQWSAEEALERLRRFADAEPKKQPVRAEKRPERNDPCPCGSGRKYKKCHGAPGAAGAGA